MTATKVSDLSKYALITETLENGKTVFESEYAEFGRKFGCLCIREKDGKIVMCEHLKKNIEFEKKLKEELEYDDLVKKELQVSAISAFEKLTRKKDIKIGKKDICPMALMLFAVCTTANMSVGVSKCPFFKSSENEKKECKNGTE